MKTVTLVRQESTDQGTPGVMTIDDQTFNSGELPWKNNESNLSCIPVGAYTCHVSHSEHFNRDLYHVLNVPNRTDVMIHPANLFGDTTKGFKSQLLGCICLGTETGEMEGQMAVMNSKIAIAQFMQLLNNEDFTLIISNSIC